MPRPSKIERIFVNQKLPWSPFPRRPLPFRMVEWKTRKYPKSYQVRKAKPPCQVFRVAPIKDWGIVRNDLVEICCGEDTGKQGKVRAVAPEKNLLKVVGLNCSRQFLPDIGNGNPGYVLSEEPLHFYEVKLVNPHTGRGTDIVLRYDELGEKVRVCKETGHVIPTPPFERSDWKERSAVKEGDLDTRAEVVQQYTYVPSLLFFHEEIMKEMNIPMSVKKTELERRDLIMKELEEEAIQEKLLISESASEEKKKSFLENIRSRFFFWL
ncbi:large ribosomal subunit protein uL24m [Hydra vulgaris]|nr:probable 39S ribosomal protein L24, mitochondrial [Hydra vulgaris]